MSEINDIVCCCNNVNDVSVIFSVNEAGRLIIVVAGSECCSRAILGSRMTDPVIIGLSSL